MKRRLALAACLLGLVAYGCSAPEPRQRERGVIDYRDPGTARGFDSLQRNWISETEGFRRDLDKNRDRYLNDR